MASPLLPIVVLITLNAFDLCESASTRKIVAALEKKVSALEEKIAEFDEWTISVQERTISGLQKTIDAQDKMNDLESKIAAQQETIHALRKDVSEGKLSRALQENGLIELKLKVNSTDRKVKSLNNTVDTLTSGLEAVKTNLHSTQQKVGELMDRVVGSDSDSNGTIPQSVLPGSYADYTVEVDSLSNKVDTLTQETRQFSSGLDTVTTNLHSVQQEVGELMDRVVGTDSNSNGTIPQSLLDGSYADYTVEDIMWGSLHMAAAAACHHKGTTYGYVIPIIPGSTCSTTCSDANSSRCGGVARFAGKMGRTNVSRSSVGYWYNGYSCDTSTRPWSEMSEEDGYILTYSSLTYCCCTK